MLIINGMMRSVKYMIILGFVGLCMLVGPAMATDLAACSGCTPDTKPEIGTVCPAACIIAFDETFWTLTEGDILSVATASAPGPSVLSGKTLSVPKIEPMVSILSGKNVESDLKKELARTGQ